MSEATSLSEGIGARCWARTGCRVGTPIRQPPRASAAHTWVPTKPDPPSTHADRTAMPSIIGPADVLARPGGGRGPSLAPELDALAREPARRWPRAQAGGTRE